MNTKHWLLGVHRKLHREQDIEQASLQSGLNFFFGMFSNPNQGAVEAALVHCQTKVNSILMIESVF